MDDMNVNIKLDDILLDFLDKKLKEIIKNFFSDFIKTYDEYYNISEKYNIDGDSFLAPWAFFNKRLIIHVFLNCIIDLNNHKYHNGKTVIRIESFSADILDSTLNQFNKYLKGDKQNDKT